MKQIVLKARGKINWTLDVVSKRDDGYHNVDMMMQSIDLADVVTLQETEAGIRLRSNSTNIPLDQRNLAYKAALLLKDVCHIAKGVDITIEKHIPVAAGLAGGSTDCAAVLVGLNRIWNLELSLHDLMEIGVKLGADVPFCLMGGTARAQGIGERLTPIDMNGCFWLVLIKPYGKVSTKEVYRHLNLEKITVHPYTDGVLEGLVHGNPMLISSGMANVLETVTLKLRPEISRIKSRVLETGALNSLMSGSGPTVYGIYPNRERAQKAYNTLKKRYKECFAIPTAGEGITEIEFIDNEELGNS